MPLIRLYRTSDLLVRHRDKIEAALFGRIQDWFGLPLTAPKGALVIMDAGIATAANVAWLIEQGYRYLVVSRERTRQFDPDQAISTLTASNETVRLQRVPSEDGAEVRLYCHSAGRESKETAITDRFVTRFEAGLTTLAAGLAKPHGQKKLADIQRRIGRLIEKSRGIEQHYEITVLAYQLVQAIRRKLEAAGEPLSWTRLREILSVQQRITATFQQRDGRTLHVRKTTLAEPAVRRIYDALALNTSPGSIQKLTV